jgi:hypothetical protein
MVSGLISIRSDGERSLVEIRRGMMIRTWEGAEAGKVAAVAFEHGGDQPAYILQCRLPDSPDYRKVALDFIEGVCEGTVCLSLSAADLENIPHWQSSQT